MVTPHLPPHQAANALLPHLLGLGLRGAGHEVRFLTFGKGPDSTEVAYVRRRSPALRATRLPQALEAADTWLKGAPLVRWCDVVHVHSNTWMNQVAARLAVRAGRPYVLTHYGTEIWHHDGKDPVFKRLNARAAQVAFYSQALLERGRELGVPFTAGSVVYPPVADVFQPRGRGPSAPPCARHLPEGPAAAQRQAPAPAGRPGRRCCAPSRACAPSAPRCACWWPARARARTRAARLAAELRLGDADAVRFLGLVPNEQVAELQGAADLFVLSSVLEATPTVALEALASGTPVVSTDNPGGLELGALFGDDVSVVPQRDPAVLARAVLRWPRSLRDAPRPRAPS